MQHCQHDGSPKSSTGTPSKPSASPSPLTLRTPSPSGSSALQPRLSLLSLTTESPAAGKQHQRFLEQVSLRVLTPTRMLDPMSARPCHPIPLTEPKPHRHRGVQSRRRRSRDAPYSQQFIPVDKPASPTNPSNNHHNHSHYNSTATNASEQSSADSVSAEMDTTPTRPALSPQERSNCINPVAFTLWRGGQEDREWLQEQDRSWNEDDIRVESPVLPRIMAPPRQVSNNLRDVYGANYVWEISRPIPRRRLQEDVCFVNRMK